MIDIHQHMIPPDYRAWLTRDRDVFDGKPLPQWSVESALESMETLGIEMGFLSVSSPALQGAKAEDAASLARDINEFGRSVRAAHPERFRYFASLPMIDPARATQEATHALDKLDASGVIVLANSEGTYLGDPSQWELMQELNARKAVVFIHPTSLPGSPAKDIPPFVADFMLDTTRAVIRLITSGTLDAFPDIRFILPHGGGFLPYAATRIARTTANPDDAWPKVMKQMQSFHFDLAMSATPTLLPSLLAFVGADRVCIGSDIPFPPLEHIQGNFRSLANYTLSDEDRYMIRRGTAETLFSLK